MFCQNVWILRLENEHCWPIFRPACWSVCSGLSLAAVLTVDLLWRRNPRASKKMPGEHLRGLRAHSCMSVHIHLCLHVSVCLYAYMFVYVCVYVYLCVCVCDSMCLCVSVYICVCMSMFLFVYDARQFYVCMFGNIIFSSPYFWHFQFPPELQPQTDSEHGKGTRRCLGREAMCTDQWIH